MPVLYETLFEGFDLSSNVAIDNLAAECVVECRPGVIPAVVAAGGIAAVAVGGRLWTAAVWVVQAG